MSRAYITPSVLKWARETRMKMPVEALAAKMSIKAEKILAWESDGPIFPTMNQAQALARHLRIPLGYLYLSTPPAEPPPIADYRRMKGVGHHVSPDLREVIDSAELKQEAYKDLIREFSEPVSLAGAYTLDSDPVKIAERIRNELGLATLQATASN